MTCELFHAGSDSVDDTTYLGMLLNLSAKPPSPARSGHAAAKPSYVTRPSSRASDAIVSSSLYWLPSSPRSKLKVQGPSSSFSPPGPSMTPSRDTNWVTTSFLMRLQTCVADQTHRALDELRVRRLLRVLEAHPRVEPVACRVLDEDPRGRAVAVLEDRGVDLAADRGDQRDRLGRVDVDRLDEDTEQIACQAGLREGACVLDAPHACLDPDPALPQRPEHVLPAGFGDVHRRVVGLGPSADVLELQPVIGLDPRARRDA